MSTSIARYAVIGDPVQHSLSPLIFQLFAEQVGCILDYQAIAIKPWDLRYALGRFCEQGYQGLNVTAPLKEKAFSLMNGRSESAESAQAVNVVCFNADGTLYGDNTDGLGFINDLSKQQKCVVKQRSVLVLGAGGAARGIMKALFSLQPAQVVIANRSLSRAQQLAQVYQKESCPVSSVTWKDIATERYDVVIQATAAAIHGEALLLPTGILNPGACCYDLVYGKAHLPFRRWAEEQKVAACRDGLGMLVEQAAATFYLWCQKSVDTTAVIQKLANT